jgi:hypothetical protein
MQNSNINQPFIEDEWDGNDWDEDDWDVSVGMCALDSKLANINIDNESVDAKKLKDANAKQLREKQQVEETEKLISDKSGTETRIDTDSKGDTGSITSIPLKTLEQFAIFGVTISKMLKDSTQKGAVAFMKSLCDKLPDNLSLDNYDAIIAVLNTRRDLKKRKGGKIAKVVVTKSSKVIKQEQERHSDIFGDTRLDKYTEEFGYLEDR